MCVVHPSRVVRSNYWYNNYPAVKMLNPRLPFMLREFDDATQTAEAGHAAVEEGGDDRKEPYLIATFGACVSVRLLALHRIVAAPPSFMQTAMCECVYLWVSHWCLGGAVSAFVGWSCCGTADYGQVKVVGLEGKSESDIDAVLEDLVKLGDTLPRSVESAPFVLPSIVE